MDTEYETGPNDEKDNIISSIRQCEAECNQKFMSLLPVEQDWLDSEVSFHSTSNT